MNKRKYLIGGYVLPANVYNTFARKKVLKENSVRGRDILDQGSRALAQGFNWIMGKAGNAFNTILTAGASTDFGQTSPFTFSTSEERENIAKGREKIRLKAKRTIEENSVYVSPTSYIAAWTLGSWDPKVGAEVLASDPRLQSLGIIGDLATFKYTPKVVKAVPATVDKGLAVAGNKGAKGRVVAREINKAVNLGVLPQQPVFPGLVGWGEKQTFHGYHASNDPAFKPNFFFNGWALQTHNAPYGIYFALGTKPESGFLTKRPYVYLAEVDLDRPIVQIGEVKGTSKNSMRNLIERDSQQQGADGIIFLDIADNQMLHLTVLKTLNPDVPIRLNIADDVAGAYTRDRGITGPMIKFDGTNRFIWRKNRWSKEGNGLMDARFRADEYVDPHHITLNALEAPEIPNRTYFLGLTLLPFNGSMGNGLGNNISTVFTPNLLYNAFRYLHWMEPKVLELGLLYLTTGNLRPILDYYRNATPIERQQLSAVARQPLYLNSDIPYRYYNDNATVMRENPIVLREVNKMTPTERGLFNNSLGWATTNDVGAPVIFNKKTGFGGDKVVGHEGNHAYQQRFSLPRNMLELLERALPAELTKNVKGLEVPLTGNDKRMMGSAHLNVERGSTILDARAFIIRQYYLLTGRYPSFTELNSIIDNLSETELTNTIKTTSAYGREYAPLINDFNALREALKYAYKVGGKLIFKYEEK